MGWRGALLAPAARVVGHGPEQRGRRRRLPRPSSAPDACLASLEAVREAARRVDARARLLGGLTSESDQCLIPGGGTSCWRLDGARGESRLVAWDDHAKRGREAARLLPAACAAVRSRGAAPGRSSTRRASTTSHVPTSSPSRASADDLSRTACTGRSRRKCSRSFARASSCPRSSCARRFPATIRALYGEYRRPLEAPGGSQPDLGDYDRSSRELDARIAALQGGRLAASLHSELPGGQSGGNRAGGQ
jgi:hypothetical protein